MSWSKRVCIGGVELCIGRLHFDFRPFDVSKRFHHLLFIADPSSLDLIFRTACSE